MDNQQSNQKKTLAFLKLLVQNNIISPEKLKEVGDISGRDFTQILEDLIDRGIVGEDKIKQFFVEYFRLKPFDPKKYPLNKNNEALKKVSYSYQLKKKFVCFDYRVNENKVLIAAFNPVDREIMQYLKFLGFDNVEIYVATLSEIMDMLNELATQTSTAEILEGIDLGVEIEEEKIEEEGEAPEELEAEAEEAPIVKASRLIIVNAVKMGASDIHIEPFEKEVRVRYRIDGILRTVQRFPATIKEALVARYKIMANLDITEKRLPQDGRIRIKIEKKPIDLRVSTLPVIHGEKVVMRIQDAQSYLGLRLEDLGFEEDDLKKIRKAIYSPWGMVLVTGPTGSGKTTTLYTALMERNKEDVNISTAEDPVEVAIPGINQVQVREDIGLTFAVALRAFLRQDPDIILVGEIRDTETAEIAVKAALTGHLVFSTLHTNDAPSSITRMIDIGVEGFLVGTAVNLILAQRLIRKLCDNCKQPAPYPPEFWKGLGFSDKDIEEGKFYIHNPNGCEKCNKTGYKGRTAVHEILEVDDEIRKAILAGYNAQQLRDLAIKKGMRTLYQSGLLKVKRGITDLAEVERVLMK